MREIKGFALSMGGCGIRLRALALDNAVLGIASFFVKPIDGAPNGIPSWLTVWNQKLHQRRYALAGRPRGLGHARPDGYQQFAGLLRRSAGTGFDAFTLGRPPAPAFLLLVPAFEFSVF